MNFEYKLSNGSAGNTGKNSQYRFNLLDVLLSWSSFKGYFFKTWLTFRHCYTDGQTNPADWCETCDANTANFSKRTGKNMVSQAPFYLLPGSTVCVLDSQTA